jgi:hypothetical protein
LLEAAAIIKKMKLSAFKKHLSEVDVLHFELPNGQRVPGHFHLTEIGQLDKRFIDCGGAMRQEQAISMQLWTSIDVRHRLEAAKAIRIIDLAIDQLMLGDHPIEVEYQGESIQKFNLEFAAGVFHLVNTSTACLASDACGIPAVKHPVESMKLCCTPGGGCC